MSIRGIAEAAGLSPSTISGLAKGQPTIKRTTAATILAVTPTRVMTRPNRLGFVPKVGACRRIQGLLALGWTHTAISAAMQDAGVRTQSHHVLHQSGQWISKAVHDAVTDAYRVLGATHGPSERTRVRARRLGYVVPAMWDDDAIDDPTARPADVTTGRRGVLDLEEWDFLVRAGEHPIRAAERCGVSIDAVAQAANRAGRRDLFRTAERARNAARSQRIRNAEAARGNAA